MNLASEIRSLIGRVRYLFRKVGGMKSRFKLYLIEAGFQKSEIRSFADLGGVWGVDGAYTFHVLSKHRINKAYIVDDHFTEEVLERKRRYPQLELMEGDFRLRRTFDKIDHVDLIILFDVLLHQVNWQEVLSFCADKADILAIYNPQWCGENSVRLLDLGEEEYFKLVPHGRKAPRYRELFTPREERSSPAVWQWGICDSDLMGTLQQLGFSLSYSLDGEQWPNRAFRSKGFIFQKAK